MKRSGETDYIITKKPHPIGKSCPPCYIHLAITLPPSIQFLLTTTNSANTTTWDFVSENHKRLRFLIFLGAQGKEYIETILAMFPGSFSGVMFLTSSIDQECLNSHVIISTGQTCKQLAKYFNVMDPLGGGVYPLDFLIVADSDNNVRCRVPIRLNKHYSSFQKFGVDLDQLPGVINELLHYFFDPGPLLPF